LKAQRRRATPDPLVISPAVAGAGEWINTAIYRFKPSEGLAASTTYTVVVKAGLVDTTGSALVEDYVFSFRTVDPTILNWLPENNLMLGVESPITGDLLDADGSPVHGGGFQPRRRKRGTGARALHLGAKRHRPWVQAGEGTNVRQHLPG